MSKMNAEKGHFASNRSSSVPTLSGISARHKGTRSISVGSSSGARELFTRFDTGHRCSRSFGAGLSNSRPVLPFKYGGMDVSDAKRLRSLEDENRKLKKRSHPA